MKEYCFGVDIGGTTVKIGLFKTDGNLLEKWEIPTRKENNGYNILPDIAEALKAKMEEKGLTLDDFVGVGLGVPGPVTDDGDVLTAVNLFWGYKEAAKEMKSLTGLKTKVGNDANVAALGEAWKGAGEGASNMIMLTLGTGVGGGIVIDGKIVAGSHGAGGEIGHANINHEETEACNCGNSGCLEQYASATGITRLAKQYLNKSDKPSSLRTVEELSSRAVFDAYKAGDGLAADIVEDFGERLGGAMAVFACVTDPQVLVVGGGVSNAGQPLIDVISKYYRKYTFQTCKATPIVLATLGNDAGIYGCAKMVIPS